MWCKYKALHFLCRPLPDPPFLSGLLKNFRPFVFFAEFSAGIFLIICPVLTKPQACGGKGLGWGRRNMPTVLCYWIYGRMSLSLLYLVSCPGSSDSTEVWESLVWGHGTPEGIVGAPAQLSFSPSWKRNAQRRVWENSESQSVVWRTAEGAWAQAAHGVWVSTFPKHGSQTNY